jgi:hypothetical protein
MSTLRYVERAKDIINSARINEGSGSSSCSAAALAQLRQELTDLREAELQWRNDCGAMAQAAEERAAAAVSVHKLCTVPNFLQ